MRHFLTLNDFSKDEILDILNLAAEIKKEAKSKNYISYLKDQTLAMIFEKSSTRTRVSFEVGIHQLGGKGLFLSSRDIQLGRGEPVKDTARVLGRMVDMIMARVYKQSDLVELAKFSGVPVINGLSDDFHPVQLMADLLTLSELGLNLQTMKVAYIGDGNNMTNSWLMAASKLGFELRVATPKGYEVPQWVLDIAEKNAKISGANLIITNDPKVAVSGADVVTTDTWVSMGQEDEKEKRIKDFAGYCVDDAMMSLAAKDAKFLHCLPAYRGYEVSQSVFEAHAEEIFSEAENRLHAQKGVMVWCDRKRYE
ncbi:ornithine carbamoyltransferase [Campylobacter hyointestinalis subsp. hyointestinalis]|uniref:Ornithine carbamoyltransferase n=1 Tax=Campylobacter hyointestinalis subsp. hyointestinalis TaxID=91352 RepID=A0A9W5AV32_CAMHY|nr:ornithine carbamoyltransferase [Campylobacter hyointestinalis]PPB58199.1 ornithine carbamoyltransferase [Campylobacter hyointestinalis subsp. hyointestinalis]PPB66718.1 ornithine carbamoyltransferase [Campylobacter hyointestinalis subsp. hyointestinalis]PPB68432.1 ornithine carbamoyltransferase [Campylobacter hyointestinalis subsp. hyointestinalis]QCU00589.1 ornithine carbamoyltransferase [Campylobacter hyointestinalis subsp. hyointestinalis]TWO22351.1 ornithine carbamoyltransferase [Campyl